MSADPRDGGAVESMLRSSLAMKDASVHVLSLDDANSPFIENFPLPLSAVGPVARKYGYTRELGRWILANHRSFDVAVIEGLWNHASVGGAYWFRKVGLPYVLFSHGMMDPWFREKYPIKHVAKQILWWLGQGQALAEAHAVLFTCDEERHLAEGQFVGAGYTPRVVAFGTASPPAQEPDLLEAFYSVCESARGRKFLLFMSRIHPKKGCDILIEAFARLAQKYPDTDLVIAGPDQVGHKARLMALANDLGVAGRIHWPGMLKGAAKWGALYASEAMALTSHQENFGIIVAESLACGRPVLISNKVNIWREILEDSSGLVAHDDVKSAEAMLDKFLAMPAHERSVIGENASSSFKSRFEINFAAAELVEILKAARRPR